MTAVVAAGLALARPAPSGRAPRSTARAREQTFAALDAEARLMARVVEDELARGVPPDAPRPRGRRGGARRRGAGHGDRARRPRARRLRGLGRRARRAREPRRPTGGPGGARRAGSARSERHSATVGADLLYVAVPIRSGDTVVGRGAPLAQPHRDRGDRERSVVDGRSRPRPRARRHRAPVAPPLGVARPLAARDHGHRPAVRERQPVRPHPGRRDDELGELAHIINRLGRPAAGARGGDRARPRAHGGHPLGDGRRRPRRRPPRAR